ncbi:hypothetical protein HY464_01505 [Candidatus Peregrinibacteria bacterium]|nr:hypothetical protein [Candidatus Peregrinibacteria bacterium]MBI4129349.1 hypothetical protein [Candidatus Peregrinibacteria bacterium]
MDLYVRLWPLWFILAALMVNLLVTMIKAMDAGMREKDVKIFDMVALWTAAVMALVSVLNVLMCVAVTAG